MNRGEEQGKRLGRSLKEVSFREKQRRVPSPRGSLGELSTPPARESVMDRRLISLSLRLCGDRRRKIAEEREASGGESVLRGLNRNRWFWRRSRAAENFAPAPLTPNQLKDSAHKPSSAVAKGKRRRSSPGVIKLRVGDCWILNSKISTTPDYCSGSCIYLLASNVPEGMEGENGKNRRSSAAG